MQYRSLLALLGKIDTAVAESNSVGDDRQPNGISEATGLISVLNVQGRV
jgi:hypothetical protein